MTIESRVSRLERRPNRQPTTTSEAFPAHIVEFATDSRFLNLRLYPAQLLILSSQCWPSSCSPMPTIVG